ncbi:MAG: response regulator transcription factor [Cellulosilyticaceae bacterium]
MKKIFIVEDDSTIREELTTFLQRYGYEIEVAVDFANVATDIQKSQPQLVLLDINLPVFDGYYICREVRRISDVPIIIVTSRNSDMDELLSMNFGADDFITKPYNTEILLARIGAILKRSYGKVEVASRLEYKGLQLSLANGSVSYSDKSLELTKNELKILAQLMKSQGNIVSREELMEVLWQSELFIDDNTLSVNVTRLRKKLEDLGMKDVIETRRGLGYIMP